MKSARGLFALLALLPAVAMAEPYALLGIHTAGARIGAGYAFTPHLGAEAEYFTWSDRTTSDTPGVRDPEHWKASAIGIAGVATWPFAERFSIVARAGVYRWKGEFESVVASSSARQTVPILGVGFGVALSSRWGLRALFERVSDKAGMFGDTPDYDPPSVLSFTGTYRF